MLDEVNAANELRNRIVFLEETLMATRQQRDGSQNKIAEMAALTRIQANQLDEMRKHVEALQKAAEEEISKLTKRLEEYASNEKTEDNIS